MTSAFAPSKWWFFYQIKRIESIWCRIISEIFWRARQYLGLRGRIASLDGVDRIIVSLTSYPARFGILALTLKCLLTQSVEADQVVLWVTEDDFAQLPSEILAMTAAGLTILTCAELGSYKKVIPALQKWSSAAIVTADDDLFYPRNWLAQLVRAAAESPRAIVCHRAHKVHQGQNGLPLSYAEWENNIAEFGPSWDVFPTSGAGVLYRPGQLHPDVTNAAMALEICPNADDLWLYWMARRNGVSARKVGPPFQLIEWEVASQSGLWHDNLSGGGNDRKLTSLAQRFGPPHNPYFSSEAASA